MLWAYRVAGLGHDQLHLLYLEVALGPGLVGGRDHGNEEAEHLGGVVTLFIGEAAML